MIGRGMPSSQSSAPRPSPIAVLLKASCVAANACAESWFLARSRVERDNRGQYFVIKKENRLAMPSALRQPFRSKRVRNRNGLWRNVARRTDCEPLAGQNVSLAERCGAPDFRKEVRVVKRYET